MMKWIREKKVYVLAFIIPIILYCILLASKDIYPFGSLANITYDENLQYEQFFTFYYNVLHGTANIGYSLYKSIGGSLVGLWGYYLASPINLVLFFFKEMNVLFFVFIVTAFKIGLCGFTFAIFIKNLFKNLKNQDVIMLSIAYSFTQYVVGQMSNVMWLDGVYLLPLILYFIDKFLEKDSKIGLFITFMCTIIFNWYTGYMNCLFAILYFMYRLILTSYKNNKLKFKPMFKKTFSFIMLEGLSVLASAVIFVPIVLAQLGSRTGNSYGIFNFETNGSFLGMFRGFMIGSEFPSPNITMFCSILMLILIVYYFADRRINAFEKKMTLGLAGIMIASIFFCPLEHIWVGFSFETSFQIRFLYVVILTILLLAASVLNQRRPIDKKLLSKVIIGIILGFLVLDLFSQFSPKRLWIQIFIFIAYLIILTLFKNEKKKNFCLIFVFLVEILLNAYLVTGNTYVTDKNYYNTYTSNEEKMIDQIRPKGNEFYRIETNVDRDLKRDSFISNESLAHSYGTIEQYTSSYDKIASVFLGDLGYSRSEFPTFYHEPILPADSLLGVKYLLTDEKYDGYTLKNNYDTYNGKQIYENDYVLPFGFTVSSDIINVVNSGDPFEYMNDIYSGILGRKVTLFTKYQMNVSNDKNVTYSSDASDDFHVLYMRINGENLDLKISRDGKDTESYLSDHLNHNVLVLGNTKDMHTLKIMDTGKDDVDAEFYSLDLNELRKAADEIRSEKITFDNIEDGNISFTASGEKALLTIPYDNNWEVRVNGKAVTSERGASALMVIPLDGDNSEVVMTYHVKGVRIGIVFTVISIGIFSIWVISDKRAKK